MGQKVSAFFLKKWILNGGWEEGGGGQPSAPVSVQECVEGPEGAEIHARNGELQNALVPR